MLNENNKVILIAEEKNPMKTIRLSECGSFGCRRPVGEGYYDASTDRTYVCWNERGMDIYMAYYSHGDAVWSSPELVYKNDMFGTWDYHNYVTMIPSKNGEPLFYYNIHSNSMYQVKRNAQGKFERKMISDDLNAYPSPVRYEDKIYIFYSKNQEISYPYRPLRYISSNDEGETWTEPFTAIDSEKKMDRKMDEVYQCGCEFIPACGEWPDRVLLTWTMWGGPRGHASEGYGAYMVQFYLEEECFYDAEGKKIGKVIDYDTMRKYCFIEEHQGNEISYTNFGPVAINDRTGKPVVVYGVYQKDKYYLKQARFENGKWNIEVIEEDIYNVEDIKRGSDYIEIVVCHGEKIVTYRCLDGQKKFEKHSITRIVHGNNSDCLPYVNYIDKAKKEAQIIYSTMENKNFETYYQGLWPVVVLGE